MKKSVQRGFGLLIALLLIIGLVPASVSAASVGVSYQTQIENVGWQGIVSDGVMSGTSGKSLRLEGIKINIDKQGSNYYRNFR